MSTTETVADTSPPPPEPEPQPAPSPAQSPAPATSGPQKEKRAIPWPPRKLDPLIDTNYFNQVNKRDQDMAGVFKNYQINPYTKKTLDYVVPKIPTRARPFPKIPCDPCICDDNQSKEDQKILASHKIIKSALDKSVNPPKCKFCEPQTELMRLGWFPKGAPPPPPQTCLDLKMFCSCKSWCYFYPTPPDQLKDDAYDERFRAVHPTAEFIKTDQLLRQYDAIMNPDGYRGQIKTKRKLSLAQQRSQAPPPPPVPASAPTPEE